jgi:hypothetical protein
MKRIRYILIYFVLFAGAVPAFLHAQEGVSASGRITGSVSNGSQQDTIMAGFDIEVQKFSGANLLDTVQTQTDEKGRFDFQDLETDPNFAYYLRAVYKEIGYSSEAIVLDADNSSKSINLKVYEKSDDPSKVLIINYHIIIRREPVGLEVQEILSVRNGEPYTYVGIGGSTLEVTLPEEAENFSLGSGYEWIDYSILDNTVKFSVPVDPDEVSIVYYYDLKVDEQSYEFTRKMDYHAEKLDIILVVPGAGMRSEQLDIGQPFTIEGQVYDHLFGENLKQDSSLNLIIEKLPVMGINFLKAGLLAGFAFVISAVLIFISVFVKHNLRAELGGGEHLPVRKEVLIKEIAALDDDFDKGAVKEDAYKSEREKKKIDLLEVTALIEKQRPVL